MTFPSQQKIWIAAAIARKILKYWDLVLIISTEKNTFAAFIPFFKT